MRYRYVCAGIEEAGLLYSTKRSSNTAARAALFVFTILVASPIALAPAGAQPNNAYSMILRDTPFANNPEFNSAVDPNTIFVYDATMRIAVPGSTRLADGIAAQLPGAAVDALSYGHGAFCHVIPHGELHFGISRNPTNGKNGGIPGTELGSEPIGDSESDTYWVENVPATNPQEVGIHGKTLEENNHPTVRSRFSYLPYSSLGLHGVTGQPNGVEPNLSNVAGFDYHPINYALRDIYFSIEAPVGIYHPADILLLDQFGTVHIHKTWNELGLDVDDNIDALSLDLHHSAMIGDDPHAVFSLTRASPGAASPHSAADVFMVNLGAPGNYWLYRFASASGIDPGDGDIDCIVSIDPWLHWKVEPNLATPGSIALEALSRLDSVSIVVDGKREAIVSGTQPILTLDSPLEIGDRRTVTIWGEKNGTSGIVGQRVLQVDSDLATVSDLEGVVAGDSIEWSWSTPLTADSLMVSFRGPAGPVTLPLAPLPVGGGPQLTLTDLPPGVHTLCVQTVTGGEASLPACATAEIATGLAQPPSLVTSSIVGLRDVELSYDFGTDLTELELRVDGVFVGTLPGGTAGTDGVTLLTGLEFGFHRIELEGTDPERTYPSPIEVYLPRPRPGTVLRSTTFPGSTPSGATLVPTLPGVPDTGFVLFADQANGLTYRYDPETLTLVDTIPNPVAAGSGTVRGLAYDPTGPLLYWVVESSGVTSLYSSQLDGSAVSPITLPATAVDTTPVGDLCYDPIVDHFYLASPATASYLPIHRDGLSPTIGATISFAADAAPSGAVACRPDGRLDIPVAVSDPADTSDIATISDAGQVLTTARLFNSIAGELTGFAFAENGSYTIAAYYAVDTAGIVYEIAAHDVIPTEEDCHLPILGGRSARTILGAVIPDIGLADATVTIARNHYIADLDVRFQLTHEQPSDLTVELESPLGTVITLHSQSLPYQTNFLARFDDLYMPGFNDRYGDRSPSGPGMLSDFDGENVNGTWTLRVTDEFGASLGGLASFSVLYCPDRAGPPPYVVGDTNADSLVDIADGISILSWIFGSGSEPTCLETADVNGDQLTDLGDAVALFGFVFASGPPPVAPYPDCGYAPTTDIDCDAYAPCQ